VLLIFNLTVTLVHLMFAVSYCFIVRIMTKIMILRNLKLSYILARVRSACILYKIIYSKGFRNGLMLRKLIVQFNVSPVSVNYR
jgi:hypothetical protein